MVVAIAVAIAAAMAAEIERAPAVVMVAATREVEAMVLEALVVAMAANGGDGGGNRVHSFPTRRSSDDRKSVV